MNNNANSKNTVFVIGAGASKEANLPTGEELKEKIRKFLDIRYEMFTHSLNSGDHVIASALDLHAQAADAQIRDINLYLQEAWRIRDALPLAISIDNFIDAYRNNKMIALCGKLAIVRSILESEKNSLLYFNRSRIDSNIDFPNLKRTWYNRFFQLLTENCGKSDLIKRFSSVTLIIFNYDRCIEHFIYCALQNYYGIDEFEAAKFVKPIKIYHPYGVVGALPWQNSGDHSLVMEFGGVPNPEQLLTLSRSIKTFTEGTDPESSNIEDIHLYMRDAERVVFLGFAYHLLNMQLITPPNPDKSPLKNCFATALGISESDQEVIKNHIEKMYSGRVRVNMVSKSCFDFFGEYWRSLAFC